MKIFLKRFGLHFLLAACAVSLMVFTGCVAIPIAALGAGSYSIFKTTQSKGNAKIAFDRPSIEDTNALQGLQSLAIWPKAKKQTGLVSDVSLAEGLSGSFKIVTPMSVLQILESNSLPQSVEEMTGDERLRLFKAVADQTGADAVFLALFAGTKSSYGNIGSAVGIQSASSTDSVALLIFSRQKDALIWKDSMTVSVNLSLKSGGADEIQSECTAQVAKRILEITGRNTNAKLNLTAIDSAR